MKRFLCVLALFLVAAFSLYAQRPEAKLTRDHFQIQDAGQPREFELAMDEIQVTDSRKAARREKMPPRANAEAVRAYAESVSRAPGEEANLILYEAGKPRNEFTRRIVTRSLIVKLRPGVDPRDIASAAALTYEGPVAGFHQFKATRTGGALIAIDELRSNPGVESAEVELARQQSKRLLPNDVLFPLQWHLRNTGQSSGTPGMDANLVTVWDSWKGNGIRIGIVDDGLQLTHPDLSPNIDTVNDYDWNGADNDPSPNLLQDFHGTSAAGVAAARGNNTLGVSGAAPEATLVGLRLIAAVTTDSQEASAMSYRNDIIQVKSNSWGPSDDGKTLEGPGALTFAAFADAAQNGRGGLGTIFTWAGGNGLSANDNSNYDGYANSIYTIAVGALTNQGLQAYYSEPGANLHVTALSSGGTTDVVTVDLLGNNGYNYSGVSGELSDRDYTKTFGGTSSSCPLVAGVIALLLQSKPTLGWRDMQEILVRSATKIAPSDSDWITNGAGYHFNHKFGAGLINGQAAVTLASTWVNLGAQTNATSSQSALSVAIPDNNTTGITRTFDFSASNLRIENVTVTVSITHSRRGEIAVTLTSPSGTQSRLAELHSDTGANYTSWTFSTVRNWGENSQGIWTLKVADLKSSKTGTLTAASVKLWGTSVAPVNQPPSISSAQLSRSGTIWLDEPVTIQNVMASDPESDPITLAYLWQSSADGITFSDISGATGTTLTANPARSGLLVRCKVTPTAAGSSGAPFFTDTVAINRRPVQTGRVGQTYSYDSDLFLAGSTTSPFSRAFIINEFSQGNGGSKEWVELLVLKDSDLRGVTLADRQGNYCTFSTANAALWGNVRAGTLIVILNGNDRDTVLPATDDLDASDRVLVIAHNNATAFTSPSWGGLSNSAVESMILRGPDTLIIDALSLNNDNIYDPKFGTIGASTAARFNGNTEAAAKTLGGWTVFSATSATPGLGNGTVNSQFVADLISGAANDSPKFRFAVSSDLVTGLSVDDVTGVVGGSPAAAGAYRIVLERYNSGGSVMQTYDLLIADSVGDYSVGAGKEFIALTNLTLSGNLTVTGTLDTSGTSLDVQSRITVPAGGTITNTTGTVSYLSRSGATIPGTTQLIVDEANDASDSDGDGISALMEFFLGLDPSAPSNAGLPQANLDAGALTMSYSTPVGPVGVTGSVEVSGGLSIWNSGPAHTEVLSDTTVNGVRTLTIRDTGSGSTRYIRLRVFR